MQILWDEGVLDSMMIMNVGKKKDSRFEDPIRNKGEEREELLEGNMETPLLKNQ